MLDRLELDRLTLKYLDAIEAADWTTFSELWARAALEPELEAAFHSLHAGLVEEGEQAAEDADAETVRDLAEQHLTFTPRTDAPSDSLTAADAAAEVIADAHRTGRPLTAVEQAASQQLLGNTAPLPEQLGESALRDWLAGLGVDAPHIYLGRFRAAAITLRMSRDGQVRLAAREQTPQPDPQSKEGQP